MLVDHTQIFEDVVWLLNYDASHPIGIVRYKSSDMILRILHYALYISFSHTCSRASDHTYLRDNVNDPPKNGAIKTICNIVMNVVVSAAEAEIVYNYINDQADVPVLTFLIDLGHPQPTHQTPNLQHHCRGLLQRHPQAKNIKIHRHALLPAPGSRGPRKVQRLLDPKKIQPWQLPHQAPFLVPPPPNSVQFSSHRPVSQQSPTVSSARVYQVPCKCACMNTQ